MKTVYFNTRSFIRHESNVVDLGEYRRRLQACSGYDRAEGWDEPLFGEDEFVDAPEEQAERPAAPVCRAPERHRARSRQRQGGFFTLTNLPELCATLAIVVMAVTVVFRFLQV